MHRAPVFAAGAVAAILVWQGATARSILWLGLFLSTIAAGLADSDRIALWCGLAGMAAFHLAERRFLAGRDAGNMLAKPASAKLSFAAASVICGALPWFPPSALLDPTHSHAWLPAWVWLLAWLGAATARLADPEHLGEPEDNQQSDSSSPRTLAARGGQAAAVALQTTSIFAWLVAALVFTVQSRSFAVLLMMTATAAPAVMRRMFADEIADFDSESDCDLEIRRFGRTDASLGAAGHALPGVRRALELVELGRRDNALE